MERDRIRLHSILRLCVSKCAVTIIGNQSSKIYILIASKYRLVIRTILKLCISSIDKFCVLKVIGSHVNNDNVGFLTIIVSSIVMELNCAVFPHARRTILPELHSTARPGVIDQDIGSQALSCLIDPDMLRLGNFARTLVDGISFRVIFSLCHREPYTATCQRGVRRICCYAIGIVLKSSNTVAQNRDVDHTGSRLNRRARLFSTHGAMVCSLTFRIIEGRFSNDSGIGSMGYNRYILFCLNLFTSPVNIKLRSIFGGSLYRTRRRNRYFSRYFCKSGFGMTFCNVVTTFSRTAMCCHTNPPARFCGLYPCIISSAIAMSKCSNRSAALFFSAHTAMSSGVFTRSCTGGCSCALTYPCVRRFDVVGCGCVADIAATDNRSVFCTLPIMSQRIDLSCLSCGRYCCFSIFKHTRASTTGPISKRACLSTGGCLNYCFGQVVAKSSNCKHFANFAVSVVHQSLCPGLFHVGRHFSNVVCTSVCSTCRCLISFCLLHSNYNYFVSDMTIVFTRTACYKMIYMVAIFIRGPIAQIGIIRIQMAISGGYNQMAHCTDSILCTSRITYRMRPTAITAIVTYRTYFTVLGVIMSHATINCIVGHIGKSLMQCLKSSTGHGIGPACKRIVVANIGGLGILIVTVGCYGDLAILYGRGFGGVTIHPCDGKDLNLATYAVTCRISVTFRQCHSATRISLGMLTVHIVAIHTSLRVVVGCFIAFNLLCLRLNCFINPLSSKYSSVGCHLLCCTGRYRGNFRRRFRLYGFGVSTVTYMGSSTFCIVRIPTESDFTVSVTGGRCCSIGISVSTHRAGMGSISTNRTGGCGYYSIIAVAGCICFSIGIRISTHRTGMGCITISRTGGVGDDGVIFVSLCRNINDILRLGTRPIYGELCRVSGDTHLRTGCRSLFCADNFCFCSLRITTVTVSACSTSLTVFTPNVVRYAILVCGYVFSATNITVVIVVVLHIGAGFAVFNFTATIVTDVILVVLSILVLAEAVATAGFTFCTIIAVVICVRICTSADGHLTTVVTNMILVGIHMFAKFHYSTVVAVVVIVAVFVFAEVLYGTAVVTFVVLVGVLVLTIDLTTTIVTLVILVSIITGADGFLTAVFASMIMVGVTVLAHVGLTAVAVTHVISVLVNVAEGYAGSSTTLRASSGSFASCITIGVGGYIFLTTHVAVVILITVFIGASLQNCTTAVITYVILVVISILVIAKVGTASVFTFCTIVTVVILVGILTDTDY